MSPLSNPDNYSEIRQIVVDAIEPLKEQLRAIAESLKEEYARKDVIGPQLRTLHNDVKDLKNQMLTAPQRLLIYICTLAGLILTIINIASHFGK